MCQFLASGGQSIGVSASASVLPVNIQDQFLLGLTVLAVQGTLKSLLQHHGSKVGSGKIPHAVKQLNPCTTAMKPVL